jgi:Erv1 / Alr family
MKARTRRAISNKRKTQKKGRVQELYYTKEEYDSNNGMMTSIWGPPTWHLLHCISFNYPVHPTEEQKAQYKDFVLSLQNVLPCGKCRKNLKSNLAKLPLRDQDMESRETFSKYIFKLHETVNTMLHKHSGLSYDIVRDRYEHFRARCANTNSSGGSRKKNRSSKELGCTVPFYGKKQKCVMRIVDHSKKCKTFL